MLSSLPRHGGEPRQARCSPAERPQGSSYHSNLSFPTFPHLSSQCSPRSLPNITACTRALDLGSASGAQPQTTMCMPGASLTLTLHGERSFSVSQSKTWAPMVSPPVRLLSPQDSLHCFLCLLGKRTGVWHWRDPALWLPQRMSMLSELQGLSFTEQAPSPS